MNQHHTTPTPRDTVHRRRYRPVIAGALALLIVSLILGQGQADLVLALTNTSDAVMEVYVGGDRVRIIAPHDTEFLDVNPYVWAWPRKIEVRRYPHGERLLYWRADLTDLAQNHWRLRIP